MQITMIAIMKCNLPGLDESSSCSGTIMSALVSSGLNSTSAIPWPLATTALGGRLVGIVNTVVLK